MSKIIYKNYSEEEALELVKKRYENIEGKLPFTIPLLEVSTEFRLTFEVMKKKSYPDWVIYMAIVNTVINYRINHSDFKHTSPKEDYEQWKKYSHKIETKDDLTVPISEFTEYNLEFAIDLYTMSFLKGQGYELRRATPNIKRLRKFAEEYYKMFKFDIPHKKWFSFQKDSTK